jgi:hypothetical protein
MKFLVFFFALLLSFLNITSSHAADDLCPQDSATIKNAPGDVAGVQADIDRLNLCVERAKLLKQLDDISKQRADTLNKIKDPVGSALSGGNMAGGVSGIAPLPINALPDLPAIKTPVDIKPGETRIHGSTISPFGDEIKAATEAPKKPSWKIRKIWGQAGGVAGATMQAQLNDGNGNLLNVTKGDPLPDGSVVDSVSVKGVTLSQKGKIDTLSWDETGDSPSSNPASGSPAPANNDKITP